MSTVTIDQAIDTINQLPLEQQEMLVDILRKRLTEIRRQHMAQDAQESLEAFRQGEFVAQSAEQVIVELRGSMEEPNT